MSRTKIGTFSKVAISLDSGYLKTDFVLSPRIEGSSWIMKTDKELF
jgi:hypothetical protein